MKIMIPAVMALATAPAIQAWTLGPSYLPSLLDTPSTVGGILKRQRELADHMLEQTDRMIEESTPFPPSP
jgi:hypothetical protein